MRTSEDLTSCKNCLHREEGPHFPHPDSPCGWHWGECDDPEWCPCTDYEPENSKMLDKFNERTDTLPNNRRGNK